MRNIKLSPTARGLLTLYIPSGVISFGEGMTLPTLPLLATSFDVSIGLAAQAVTLLFLGRTVALIPAGIIVDRLGRKQAMIIGPLLIAAGALTTVVTPSFSLLLVAQFVTGAGYSLWQLGREVAAVDLVQPEQRGRTISGLIGLNNVGRALGPLLGGVIADLVGFRAVFLVYMVMALLVLPIALTVKEAGARRSTQRTPLLQFGSLKDIDPYYRATFLVLMFATVSATMRMTTMISMLPLYVGTHLGYSTTEVGVLFAIVGFINLAMIGPTGFISDKIGRKAAMVPGAALSAIAFVGFPFADTMLEFSILTGIFGLSTGLALGALTTATYDIAPESGRAQFQALRRTVGEVGALSGPLLAFPIANAFNPGTPFLFYAPVQLLAGLLLFFVARETLARKRRPPSIPD